MQRPIARHCKLLGKPALNPAVTGSTSRKAKTELMKNIYKQVVHWKAIFFTLPRNKTGLKFTDTLNEILSATLNDFNAEMARNCAMMMPHLLERARTEDDASNNKTIARRLDQWIKWDIDSLLLEAKSIQEFMSSTKAKRSFDDYKEFDEHMSTGKISNAIRSLTEEAKGGILSLTDKVDIKTVLDILREKNLEPSKANLNYLVIIEHPKSLPYH